MRMTEWIELYDPGLRYLRTYSMMAFVAFFFGVGVITSIRWANRKLAALTIRHRSARQNLARLKQWETVPAPRRHGRRRAGTAPDGGAPLRNDTGPRDWSPPAGW